MVSYLLFFTDASSRGVCAAVYAVVDQLKGKSEGLLISKSRPSKKKLTIPQLGLIATPRATNLISSTKRVVRIYPVPNCYG